MKGFTTSCDRAVGGVLGALVVVTPFAFGSVHRWAYTLLETAVFSLTLVWMAKLAIAGPPGDGPRVLPPRIAVPLALFLGLALLQLVPLPPAALRAVAPSTYALYELAFPDWPARPPYADLLGQVLATDARGQRAERAWIALPTSGELAQAGIQSYALPRREPPGGGILGSAERAELESALEWHGQEWHASFQTLSLEPAASRRVLLKLVSALAAFCLAALYPWNGGSEGERRFVRLLFGTIVATGAAVATIGLVTRLGWNGRILWFFVPHDWYGPHELSPQTSGPFVSRNNFAGYLAAILPLAVARALAAAPAASRGARWRSGALGWLAAALIGVAILWSLSRGGWLAALAGCGAFLLLLRRGALGPPELGPGTPGRRLAALACIAALVAAAALAPVAGPGDGSDIEVRLEQTVGDSASWSSRLATWRDTLTMVRDFPLLGVGLGAWPALFPRYDREPWDGSRSSEAHNDYLQLLAETGLAGIACVALALLSTGLAIAHATGSRSPRARLQVAGAAGGLVALAVHEMVDFDLQIPAIALLAALLLGVVLRDALPRARDALLARSRALPVAAALAALGGVVLAIRQPSPLALASVGVTPSVAVAREGVLSQPTSARAHLELAVALDRTPASPWSAPPLERALALEPKNPHIRDALAAHLIASGQIERGLAEIEESTRRTPTTSAHRYLSSRLAPWLSPAEQAAAEAGLSRAWGEGNLLAARALAQLYVDSGRRAAALEVWEQAAQSAATSRERAALLRRVGAARAGAGELDAAERALRAAIALEPADTATHAALITEVLAPRGALADASAAAADGVARGADRVEISLALARAARGAGDLAVERRALEAAVAARPSDARGHMELGEHLLARGKYDQAARSFERAATIDRAASAIAWCRLGVAAERAYVFDAAEKAFARSLKLDPQDTTCRAQAEAFHRRLAAGAAVLVTGAATLPGETGSPGRSAQ